MAKLTTIKVPVTDPKSGQVTYEERQGYVALLQAGEVKVKCFLQLDQVYNEPSMLVHHASGHVIMRNLNAMRVQGMCHTGSAPSYRRTAQIALAKVIDRHGAQAVLDKMNAVPKIN